MCGLVAKDTPSLIERASARAQRPRRPRRRGPTGRRAARRRPPAWPREPPAFRHGDRVDRRVARALRLRGTLASPALSPCSHAPSPCGHALGRPAGRSGCPLPQCTALPPPSGAGAQGWRAAKEEPRACGQSRPIGPFAYTAGTRPSQREHSVIHSRSHFRPRTGRPAVVGAVVPARYRPIRPMSPVRARVGTRGTRADSTLRPLRRLGAGRSQVQILSPRFMEALLTQGFLGARIQRIGRRGYSQLRSPAPAE
jgi:hypothetical protein